jgi:hypothetical protein
MSYTIMTTLSLPSSSTTSSSAAAPRLAHTRTLELRTQTTTLLPSHTFKENIHSYAGTAVYDSQQHFPITIAAAKCMMRLCRGKD